jgi:hypothetical protein
MQNAYFAKPACWSWMHERNLDQPASGQDEVHPITRSSPKPTRCRLPRDSSTHSSASAPTTTSDDDLYLGYYLRFVKTGGQIGMVLPGLAQECETLPPPHLEPHWKWDFCAWRTRPGGAGTGRKSAWSLSSR